MMEDILCVAVGENVKENRSILLWALQNSGGKKICIIHVHQPPQMIPFMGTRWPASSLLEEEVRAYREIQRLNMNKILVEYLFICRQMGARADTLHTELDCIEMGIVELISQHGIKELVMGAAADKHYAKKLMDLKSKKAIYVCLQAPVFCQIKFICKGNLINIREGILNGADAEVRSSLLQASQDTKTGPSTNLRLSSVEENNGAIPINPDQDLLSSESFGGNKTDISSINCTEELSTPWSRLDAEGSSKEWDMIPSVRIEVVENGLESRLPPESKENLYHSSPLSILDKKMDDTPYAKLEEAAMAQAENARHEAFEDSARRGKAEKVAIEAMRRAKVSKRLYAKESKQRKEIQEALAKEKEKLEKMKKQQDEITEELRIALDKKSLLENQIAETEQMVKGLEMRIASALELMERYKRESDELKIERDNALKEVQALRSKQGEVLSTYIPHFSDFSYSEIKEATQNFDPSLKIGEGRYRSIYKGLLRHTQVAIKIIHHHSLQEPLGFQHEVDIFSKMRHPNLVTLIGSCQEACALIYEYLPKGSLEDRLRCKDDTPPLSWQNRIRIATELCSVLIFLHSSKPSGIVHGDLTPGNILLDANFFSKLGDFGICHLLPHDQSSKRTTLGTFAYMDPEFLSTAELTLKSDVYSFGIILLQLLTGRTALRISKDVQNALDAGKLKELLDPSAGYWPFEQAEQLAYLALRCCAPTQKSWPDLRSEVWTVLEPMRALCGGSSSIRLGYEEHPAPPRYLVCPISQEVMRDPYLAADGYTYEAEAFRKWVESGHDTSPMTNVKLEHCNLVPNHALRSAIQDCWNKQSIER